MSFIEGCLWASAQVQDLTPGSTQYPGKALSLFLSLPSGLKWAATETEISRAAEDTKISIPPLH